MVLLHVKGSDKEDEFIYQCHCSDSVDQISRDVINIHNLRMKIRRFAHCIQELAKYGPMRPEQQRLLSNKCIQETMPEAKIEDADLDPNGLRVGKPCSSKVQETINKAAGDALNYIDQKRAHNRQVITMKDLQNHFDCMKGAVLIAFPMGLPDYDVITSIINDTEDVKSLPEFKKLRDPKTGQLWFAAHKLLRKEKLSKYIGNNEKTKIVIKITNEKGHMPVREAAVTKETQQQMMAFWHKKQEEEKTFQQDNDTSYLSSDWADTASLKQSMIGVSDVRFR